MRRSWFIALSRSGPMALLGVLLAAVVIAGACGSAATTQPTTQAASSSAAADDTVEQALEPTSTPEAANTQAVAAEPPTGRVALAAAAGEPHVLWFWGAH